MGSILSAQSNAKLKKSNVKLQAQQVTNFNGNPLSWRSWKKKTRAAIGTAGMLGILDDDNYAERNKVDNETIFHILQVATADGSAAHLVDTFESKTDGHAAYNELVTWYEGDQLTTETGEDVRSKLEKLRLDTKTSASEYINNFQLYTKQLHELGESYTSSKTVYIFLDQITNPDYETTKELCIENKYKVTECMNRIRAKERRLMRDQLVTRKKSISIRRIEKTRENDEDQIDIRGYINNQGYYSIPRETWNQLDKKSKEEVKKFNGDLRKRRRNSNNNNNRSRTNPDRSVTNRRTESTNSEPLYSLPNKKRRLVQFKDEVSNDEEENHPNMPECTKNDHNNTTPSICQRSNEILSFQVNESKA